MAMRPRTPTFWTQPSTRRVYETFQPKSEMKENPEAYLLNVYLSGFTSERINVTYVDSSRALRITGERPIDGGNRWSRFDQSYPVPENCEAEKLQGKFNIGTLTLTMPKKITSRVSPKEEVKKTTQDKGPSPSKKDVDEPKDEKSQEAIPQQPTTTRVEEPVRDKKSASLPKGQEEFEPKLTPTMPPKKQTDEKPQKGQEEVEPKPTLTTVTIDLADEKHQEEIRLKAKLPTVKKQLSEKNEGKWGEDAEKERVSKKEVKEGDIGKPSESRKPEKDVEKGVFKEKEIRTRKVSPKIPESSASKAPEKEKETSKEGKSKEDVIDRIGKGIGELVAAASQVVTRIAEGKCNDEEKHLVVNMGAAVLVIAALGAYVSYRFSSGRT